MNNNDVTIAISTLGAGISTIPSLPQYKNVCYLIVWQHDGYDDDLVRFHERSDVVVHKQEGRGLSRSRNLALECCKTRYLWVGDDDVVLDIEGIFALVDVLKADPRLALASGMLESRPGVPFKAYASKPFLWTPVKAARISSVEIVLDVEKVRAAHVRFDERFGLGASWTMGEEFIFVSDLIRKGLYCQFCPIRVGMHPDESTGRSYGDPAVWMASSMALSRVFGVWAPFYKVVMLWRKRRFVKAWSDRVAFMKATL